MGHSADASNRLKSNKELRLKKTPYLNFKDYARTSPTNKKYQFKIPTPEEIKKLNMSNELFLKKRKRRNRIVLIIGLKVAILVLYWFSETTLWRGYIEGLGKYTG